MPRILILAHYFYPSAAVGAKRMAELACLLRDEKWEVTVVSSTADAVPELAERIQDIDVTTVRLPPKLYPAIAYWPKRLLRWYRTRRSGGNPGGNAGSMSSRREPASGKREGVVGWLKRHYHAMESIIDESKLWSFKVLLRTLRIRKSYDWIISSGPPHSIHVTAALVSLVTGARWIMDLRDPWVCNHNWPDKERSASAVRDRIERFLERKCVGRAHGVTVASPGIAVALRARIPWSADKVNVVLNGYDRRMESSVNARGGLRLLYAGSLYLNRNPFPLLDALRELLSLPHVDRRRVSFILVGQCESWNGHDVAAWVQAAGMQDVVRILPPVPPAEVGAMMRDAEVLVNFAQGQPEQIPAKVYDYIAAGREMLLIAETDSDAARITRESGMGRIVDPDDPVGLRSTLRELYAFYVEEERALEVDEERVKRFSREYQNRQFLQLFTKPQEGAACQAQEDL